MIYSDVVKHEVLGNIYVYWQHGKVKDVSFSALSYDMLAEHNALEVDFPEVYSYLKNFSSSVYPPFSIDILNLNGYTQFYKDVYSCLFATGKGELITYGELAAKSGYGAAARAVGTAMRKNRFPVLIPCHRVVSSGGIGGYSTGLHIKYNLLDLEKADYKHLIPQDK